ncbi:MAG: dihydrofolate reductase family protein [Bacteroidota bacterium]|nr:dihydrofolate reductase family protein [Bacteroidota bacterium]
MRKVISFMHLSLDGFVAGPNGEMNWIKVNEEIFDYVGERIAQTDTAIYGRNTYEMMENYWPNAGNKPGASKHDIDHSTWYNKAYKIVLSRTMKDTGITNASIINDHLSKAINELKQGDGSEILVFGSPSSTHSLIQQHLIDGFWLFVNPIILGEGIPLFAGIKDKIKLNLLNTKQFSCGVTELNYVVANE